jgi:hypothetical protein
MAGRDEMVCVRTMTDVPKVNVRKVPSNGEEDDVEQKLKKGFMSFRRKDSVILGTNYLTNTIGMTQMFLAMGAGVLYK